MNIQKLKHKLWIYSNTLYKVTISRLKQRYKKYYRINIDKENYLNIKHQDEFVASIQLSRFVNTIRSTQRNYLRIPNNGSLPNTKDRIENQYIYASIIYEIIQWIFKLSGDLRHVNAWKNNKDIRKELQKEKDWYLFSKIFFFACIIQNTMIWRLLANI